MPETFIGEIHLVPYPFAPRGFTFCAGQVLPINQFQALFSLIGNTFGGDGRATFALPDLRDQPAPRLNYVIALGGIFPSRD